MTLQGLNTNRLKYVSITGWSYTCARAGVMWMNAGVMGSYLGIFVRLMDFDVFTLNSMNFKEQILFLNEIRCSLEICLFPSSQKTDWV